jgi:hypothetical protein
MAFSATDPASAHSLWSQLRNTKRKRRASWRSDWTPLWALLLLFSSLAVFYVMMPSHDAVKSAEPAAEQETVLKERPMQDALAEP